MLLNRHYMGVHEIIISNRRELELLMLLRKQTEKDQRLFYIAINAISHNLQR
jgi:hypothetical protein